MTHPQNKEDTGSMTPESALKEILNGLLVWPGYADDILDELQKMGFTVVPAAPTNAVKRYIMDNAGPVGCCCLTPEDVDEIYEAMIKAYGGDDELQDC